MTSISAVIITFNEELNIRRCIESLMNVVDEIIVVDSFSTDQTKAICDQYPIKFIQIDWMGYSQTKNYGNSLTSHNYILSIDADEALSRELQDEIKLIKKGDLEGVYAINRITNYCGKWIYHSGWFPDWKFRLFPKRSCKWNDSIVHEELEFPSLLRNKRMNGLLEHYSYHSFKQHQEKADKYSILTAQKYYNQNKKSGVLSPFFSSIARFLSMYVIKLGFLDGYSGYKIAIISAKSNYLKYKELNRLYKNN
jgi:(heptosyl)LPS beta-1,4-glucosyltransferase